MVFIAWLVFGERRFFAVLLCVLAHYFGRRFIYLVILRLAGYIVGAASTLFFLIWRSSIAGFGSV